MLFPVSRLIEGKDKPLCAQLTTTVRDALKDMIMNRFSQLPIVDDNGYLRGLISEQSISHAYFELGPKVNLLDLTVDYCPAPATTIPPERDLFKALALLEDEYAVVVVSKDNKPIGILTAYDLTRFFKDVTGGLVLIEDIEVPLRQRIDATFPDEQKMDEALKAAFGFDKREPTKPGRKFDDLTLGEYIQLMTTEKNWTKFDDAFGPKPYFTELMGHARDIRNQLAHFRGRLDRVQEVSLQFARDWLEGRPNLGRPKVLELENIDKAELSTGSNVLAPGSMDGYERLYVWLLRQGGREDTSVRLTLRDIEEKLLGAELDSSAKEHPSWWANDIATSQGRAWLRAGWRVEHVDLVAGQVTFRRTRADLANALMADLLDRLKAARPDLTRATKVVARQPWFQFGAGKTGVIYQWAYGSGTLRVELFIDEGDREKNKKAFDTLKAQQKDIEQKLGFPLKWERFDDGQASKIYVSTPVNLMDTPEALETSKEWAIQTTLKFVDVFQDRVKRLE
jgi:CBS domain-containing protein